ncbi:uncharacterized protein LOC112093727 [Morus notabilis]|uniref:uncharacterized protein LOC112093727 n=1 Tax=Morus notabilis TaxID=981085 RepID=UPI000CED4E6E|nr:uncharacterized protein LOC112093727 [Morus notabilis]
MAPPLPDKYRSPSIPPYDGRGDPDDHLEMYTGHMLLHGWDELKEAFSLQFIGIKKYVPPKQNLTTLYQKLNESLREWLARYGEAIAATMDITDREALMGALSSYINAEEADANDPEHRSNKNKGTEQGPTPVKHDGKKRQGGGNGNKQPASTSNTPETKKPRQEENRKPRPFQRYDSYHELIVGAEEVFNQVSRGNLLRRPEPMRSDPSRRNQKKYCRFHGDVGHHTNDCADLKDEIERVIRDGRLQEFKAERRPRNDGHSG